MEASADALSLLTSEIELAQRSHRPMSRRALAELVAERTGMPFRDAHAVVEAYCDANAAAVPEYLGGEFSVFWLKVIAVVNVLVGLGAFYNSAAIFRAGKPAWPLWCLGTIFCGIGAFFWARSLDSWVQLRKRFAKERDEAVLDPIVPAKAAVEVATKETGSELRHNGFLMVHATPPNEQGEGGVVIVAPDNTVAAVDYTVGETFEIVRVMEPENRRWGVWTGTICHPMTTHEGERANLEQIVNHLAPVWEAWSKGRAA